MRIPVLAVALAAAVPTVAVAQSEEPVAPEGTLKPPPDAEEPTPLRVDPGSSEPPRDSSTARHTVEQGDTLWDLSQKYLGSPWYWPKVWSYNPDIANPHWIYPGNVVRFSQGGEEVPAEVVVGDEPEVQADLGDADPRIQVSGRIGFTPRPAQAFMLPGFVTPAEVDETGSITGSHSETFLLSTGDQVFLSFKRKQAVRLGETYVVFRRDREVYHPVSGRSVGFLTKILGEARVLRVDDSTGVVVAQINRCMEPIQRGDLIGPSGEPLLKQVSARPADRDVKGGVIIAGTNTYISLVGEHNSIIIDLGAENGVKVGNIFTIWRQHDPATTIASLNPTVLQDNAARLDVGECVAVDVKSKATVCLVSRSIRDLRPGDHAEIRAAGRTRSAAIR